MRPKKLSPISKRSSTTIFKDFVKQKMNEPVEKGYIQDPAAKIKYDKRPTIMKDQYEGEEASSSDGKKSFEGE